MTLALMMSLGIGISSAHAAAAGTPKQQCSTPDITGGGSCVSGPVALTAQERAIAAKKNALAEEYQKVLSGAVSSATYQSDWQAFIRQYGGPTKMTLARANSINIIPDCVDPCDVHTLGLTQHPQLTWYYCGPATAQEVLGVRGVNVSQSTLAGNNYLKTDATGQTSWNPYVMGPTLNALTGSSFYIAVNGYDVGGNITLTTWESNLQQDINQGWALAGNTVENANSSPHLPGHPSNLTIYHWIAVYGYSNFGATTYYADSISGTNFWSWSPNVARYNSFASSNMVILLNHRGYIW